MEKEQALLEMNCITKTFPGVVALDNVEFNLRPGEVHVLLGENGAGKSTLIKIISGAYSKDAGGQILIGGKEVEILSPKHAQELGISTVYQEFNLVPHLNVAENIFLGRQPLRKGFIPTINKSKMVKESKALLKSLDIDLNPQKLISDLGVAQKQMVEITKVLAINSRICIFDEPTATLTSEETRKLFELINRFKNQGMGVIFISHRLEEVFELADRITVMRNGQYVATVNKTDVTTSDLVMMMVGHEVEDTNVKTDKIIGEEILRVENLSGSRYSNINLNVRTGEIVGIAGLVGAGRTEVLRGIFGADKLVSGKVILKGKEVRITSPKNAVENSIALLPEDRKKQGLVLCRSVGENIIISALSSLMNSLILSKRKISVCVQTSIKALRIKTPNENQLVRNLSGGNQQKVIIARWLAADSDLLMFDEPTRGIDRGGKTRGL